MDSKPDTQEDQTTDSGSTERRPGPRPAPSGPDPGVPDAPQRSQAPLSALFGSRDVTLRDLQQWAGRTERAHGWWGELDIPAKLCLIHSEVSEALEEYRKTPQPHVLREDFRGEGGKPEGFASELADIVIRTCGLAEQLGVDLATVCVAKQHYNDKRPYKHGGKAI